VLGVLVLGRLDGLNDVVVSVLDVVVSVPDVVDVSPGSMSVVTGGLVLVIVSVAVDVDDENDVRPPDVLGSR
jgi:hypothetical protein